jgi:hypothetical protein
MGVASHVPRYRGSEESQQIVFVGISRSSFGPLQMQFLVTDSCVRVLGEES